jgi:Na+-driven multidrug efflux pump
LYTTRIILTALGVHDFGIFNLVAGVISMLSFLNVSLAVASQRYMSFYLGSGDKIKLQAVFKTSVLLHLVVGFLVVIILEIAGLFLFDGFLNIPNDRVQTAKYVFHFMVISSFFTINAVPYDAAINAHENMLFDSIVGVFESILKLCIAIFISYSNFDRLFIYSLLMASLIIFVRLIKSFYCNRKYWECRIHFKGELDVQLLKEMNIYAGWNLYGTLCSLGKTQGLAVMFNVFFGTVINAAYGIANQVSAQLNFFSQTMLKALNPQIVKSEGSNNRERMLRLAMMASKFGFLLLAFIAIPIIFEMPNVLRIWLINVPEYTVLFCSYILLAIMINQLTIGLDSAIHATGNIKWYMIIAGTIKLLILPFGYILLKLGFSPNSVLVGYAFFEGLAGIARLLILRRVADLDVNNYIKNVFGKIFFPVLVSIIYMALITSFLKFDLRFLFTIPTGSLFFLLSAYFFGVNTDERYIINELVKKIKTKLVK